MIASPPPDRHPALGSPEQLAAHHYGAAVLVTAHVWRAHPDDVAGDTREQPAVFARQVAWWLLSDLLEWSSQRIARVAGRDHCTVSHALRVVEDRIATEPATADRAAEAMALFGRITE